MAFEQYTRCVKPADYRRRSFVNFGAAAAAVSGALGALAFASPWCLVFLIPVFGLVFLIAYCRNFLYERLICLDGDRDVIGVVAGVQPPPGFFEPDWDNDYSINLLLEGTEIGVTQAEAEQSEYGELIKPHEAIMALEPETPGYEEEGYQVEDPATKALSATLHAEFEGAGNYDLMQISEGMLAFSIAAFLACLVLPWPISVLLALAALLGFAAGAIGAKTVRTGSPSDVNPDIKTLEINADVVYVQGTWVYDPLHAGWNEIHPIKVCCIVGKCDEDGTTEPTGDVILRLRDGFQVARAEETRANQARPEHQWQTHPDLDGCAPDIIL